MAQAVHEASARRSGPLVVVDCGAIPHHLIESELFGPISEVPSPMPTLIASEPSRAPMEVLCFSTSWVSFRRSFSRSCCVHWRAARFSASATASVDRLMCAWSPPPIVISKLRFRPVGSGKISSFALAVVTIRLPPLRERGEDVIVLARHILEQLGQPDAIELEGRIAQALMAYGLAWERERAQKRARARDSPRS